MARVGSTAIYAADVAAQAARAGSSPREALDDLVRFELLAERAAADPAHGLAPPRELLVERLLEHEFEPSAVRDRLPDEELRRLYERARDAFVHPRLVEVVVLAVYTGARMKPEPRARARATAEELARAVASRPIRTGEDLEALARGPDWSSRRVSSLRAWQGPDKPFGPALGAEVVKLRRPGETTPLVEDETGCYIARYLGEKAPRNVPFEEARPELGREYLPRWRQLRFLAFADRLIAGHGVQVFPQGLSPSGSAPQAVTPSGVR